MDAGVDETLARIYPVGRSAVYVCAFGREMGWSRAQTARIVRTKIRTIGRHKGRQILYADARDFLLAERDAARRSR